MQLPEAALDLDSAPGIIAGFARRARPPVPNGVAPPEQARSHVPGSVAVAVSVRGWVRSRTTLPRDVLVLGVVAFCVAVGFGVLVPVLPVFARSFGVDDFAVGAVVSVFAMLRLATSPSVGAMIGRLGERVVMSAGIFVVAASSGLAGLSRTYLQLLLLRGVGGFGSAMFTVSAMTLLLRVARPEVRGRAVGFYQGGFLVGGMAGPAVGAALAAISLTAPFFFYAATLLVAGGAGLALLRPGPGAVASSARTPGTPLSAVIGDVRYQAACLANLAQGWTSLGVRSTLVPVIVVEVLHRPTSWTGIAFAAAAVVQTLCLAPVGRYADTVGRRPVLLAGCAVGALSIVLVPYAPNIWLLGGLLCVFGFAAAALGTAPAASVGDALRGGNGTPVAVFSMCSDVGSIIGPLAAGALADRVGFGAAFAVAAGLLVVAGFGAQRMPRRVPASPPPAGPRGTDGAQLARTEAEGEDLTGPF